MINYLAVIPARTEIPQTPYITAYLAALMGFVDTLQLPDITLDTYAKMFIGIGVLGTKAERNQRLNQFLQNNVRGHLEKIVEEFGFPMEFGDVEYYEINQLFETACKQLNVIPFDLFYVNPQPGGSNGNQIIQNVGGNSMVFGNVTGSMIIGGNGNNVGIGNVQFGNNYQVNTGGGDFAGGSIRK